MSLSTESVYKELIKKYKKRGGWVETVKEDNTLPPIIIYETVAIITSSHYFARA